MRHRTCSYSASFCPVLRYFSTFIDHTNCICTSNYKKLTCFSLSIIIIYLQFLLVIRIKEQNNSKGNEKKINSIDVFHGRTGVAKI